LVPIRAVPSRIPSRDRQNHDRARGGGSDNGILPSIQRRNGIFAFGSTVAN
jgi:hypothetical protein